VNIIVLNQDWFVREFREAGHRVLTVGTGKNMELRLDKPLCHVAQLYERMPERWEPDLLIAYDNSAPIIISGLEEVPYPTIFYAVDTHHHTELHTYLSQLFDYTLVAHKDYIAQFTERGFEAPEWMPLWASVDVQPSETKEYGAVFVGTLNRELNPERVDFFEALQKKAEITVTTGAFWEIFPKSEIVVNQTVKADLNFRVFEAMICGIALLTERIGNGLLDLFRENEELVLYERNNVDDCAQKIAWLLSDKALTKRLAEAGRAAILRSHMIKHRAQRFLELINTVKKRDQPLRPLGAMLNLAVLATRLGRIDSVMAAQALTECMKSIDVTIRANQPYSEEAAFYAVRSALDFDRVLKTSAGSLLLNTLQEANPHIGLFRAAKVRNLLNNGRVEEAKQFASSISKAPNEEVFKSAENAMQIVLSSNLDLRYEERVKTPQT